jgi:hypothetical protein
VGNWERGRTVSFLGIHKSDLICSVISWSIGYMEHTLSDFLSSQMKTMIEKMVFNKFGE